MVLTTSGFSALRMKPGVLATESGLSPLLKANLRFTCLGNRNSTMDLRTVQDGPVLTLG